MIEVDVERNGHAFVVKPVEFSYVIAIVYERNQSRMTPRFLA